jgi:hypothetical protein
MINPKQIMYEEGRRNAEALRKEAASLTGTEIIARETDIPDFDQAKDYTSWPRGSAVGDEGQVWLLEIPHNAAHYPGLRPAGNRACWGLAHTTDPEKAKDWVSPYGTSGLYMEGECCTYKGHVWRNLYDRNEFPPMTLNVENRWEDLGVAG